MPTPVLRRGSFQDDSGGVLLIRKVSDEFSKPVRGPPMAQANLIAVEVNGSSAGTRTAHYFAQPA